MPQCTKCRTWVNDVNDDGLCHACSGWTDPFDRSETIEAPECSDIEDEARDWELPDTETGIE